MVGTDPWAVEERLRSGMLRCPGCGDGGLAPWGHARPRTVRHGGGRVEALRPRRGRCGSCRGTHVLLPVTGLGRRADGVAVIGAALTAKAAGVGHRRIAARLGRAASTVRGWLRRFTARAQEIGGVFTALLGELDSMVGPTPPTGTGVGDAVDVIGRVAAAARRRLGVTTVVGGWSPWQLASAVTAGWLLAPAGAARSSNTSWPWAGPG